MKFPEESAPSAGVIWKVAEVKRRQPRAKQNYEKRLFEHC